jgi:hypothetical protein
MSDFQPKDRSTSADPGRNGAYVLKAGNTVHGFLDWPRDCDQHLVNGRYTIVYADDDPWKIRVGENGNWNGECCVSSHEGDGNNQENGRARKALKPHFP